MTRNQRSGNHHHILNSRLPIPVTFSGSKPISSLGIPAEMQIPIALAETIGGILLIFGVLSRISSSILSIIMLGAIFIVKEASNLTGQGGYALDLMLLASCLVIIVMGPGRVSISNAVKKIPRILH